MKLWVFRAGLILYTGVVFYMAGLPPDDIPPLWPHVDKLIHGLEFALMALLAWTVFRAHFVSVRRVAVIAWTYAAGTGLLTEVYQHFIPGRSMSWEDWAADMAGAAAVIWAASRDTRRNEHASYS